MGRVLDDKSSKLWKLLKKDVSKFVHLSRYIRIQEHTTQEMWNYIIDYNFLFFKNMPVEFCNNKLIDSLAIEKKQNFLENLIYNSSSYHDVLDIYIYYKIKIEYWMIWDLITTNRINIKNLEIVLQSFNEDDKKTLCNKYWLTDKKNSIFLIKHSLLSNYKIEIDCPKYNFSCCNCDIYNIKNIIKKSGYEINIIYEIVSNNYFTIVDIISEEDFVLFTNNITLCNIIWFIIQCKTKFFKEYRGQNSTYISNQNILKNNLLKKSTQNKILILTSFPNIKFPESVNYEIIRLFYKDIPKKYNRLFKSIHKKILNKKKAIDKKKRETLPPKTFINFVLSISNPISFQANIYNKHYCNKILEEPDTLLRILKENPKCILKIKHIYNNMYKCVPIDFIIYSAKHCYEGFQLLRDTDHSLIDDTIIESALVYDGKILELVPYKLIRKKHCKMAVKQNGISLFYVPTKYRNKKLEEIAFMNNPDCFKCIENPTYEQQLIAVRYNGKNILYIKDASNELWLISLEQDNEMIKFINPSLIPHKLATKIVEKNPNFIRYIERPTDEMWYVIIFMFNTKRNILY